MSRTNFLLSGFTSILGFILVSSLLAQEAPAPCDSACQTKVAIDFQAAEQLEKQQQYQAAADQYAAVVSEGSLSTKSQEAAIRAGQCLVQVGKFAEAINSYGTAISIADQRSTETNPAETTALKQWKYDAMFRRAESFEQLGQFFEAAQDYAAVVAQEQPSPTKQHRAIRAGQAFEKAGYVKESLPFYDQVIAVSDANRGEADEAKALVYGNWKRDALLKKADASLRAGQASQAQIAIQTIRAEFPVSLQAAKASIIEAQLNKQSTKAAEQLVAHHMQAQTALDDALRLSETLTVTTDATRLVSSGSSQTFLVQLKLKAGKGTENFWNIWINDASGNNFARWYGSGTTARGRIGTTSIVTEQTVTLTGEWDRFEVKITPAEDKTEFAFNGKSIGILSHKATAVGNVLGQIRLECIDTKAAAGDMLVLDALMVSGDSGRPILTESFDYPDGFLTRSGAWTGGAQDEMEVVSGSLQLNAGRVRYQRSLVLLDQIIATYPETGVAIAALEKKARVLTNLNKLNEAEAVFVAVLDKLRPTASHSEFFQTARLRLKRTMLEYLIGEEEENRRTAGTEWKRLRDICMEIIAEDLRPETRAQAYINLAQSYDWQHQYEECLNIAEQFLSQYDPQQFPDFTLWAQFYAGDGLNGLKRHDEALAYYRLIFDRPDMYPYTPLGKRMFRPLEYRIIKTLELTGVPTVEAQRYVYQSVTAKMVAEAKKQAAAAAQKVDLSD